MALCASVTVVFGAFSLYGAYDMAQRKKERQRQQATFVAPPPNVRTSTQTCTAYGITIAIDTSVNASFSTRRFDGI